MVSRNGFIKISFLQDKAYKVLWLLYYIISIYLYYGYAIFSYTILVFYFVINVDISIIKFKTVSIGLTRLSELPLALYW